MKRITSFMLLVLSTYSLHAVAEEYGSFGKFYSGERAGVLALREDDDDNDVISFPASGKYTIEEQDVYSFVVSHITREHRDPSDKSTFLNVLAVRIYSANEPIKKGYAIYRNYRPEWQQHEQWTRKNGMALPIQKILGWPGNTPEDFLKFSESHRSGDLSAVDNLVKTQWHAYPGLNSDQSTWNAREWWADPFLGNEFESFIQAYGLDKNHIYQSRAYLIKFQERKYPPKQSRERTLVDFEVNGHKNLKALYLRTYAPESSHYDKNYFFEIED